MVLWFSDIAKNNRTKVERVCFVLLVCDVFLDKPSEVCCDSQPYWGSLVRGVLQDPLPPPSTFSPPFVFNHLEVSSLHSSLLHVPVHLFPISPQPAWLLHPSAPHLPFQHSLPPRSPRGRGREGMIIDYSAPQDPGAVISPVLLLAP